MKATAQIIFHLLTGKEEGKEELKKLPDVNFAILVLSLQKGLAAADALQMPPFHQSDPKLSILAKLNMRRIQEITKKMIRVDGESTWKTTASEILGEFALLTQSCDPASLPHVLRIAYDLCDVPIDTVESIKYLLKGIRSQQQSGLRGRLNVESINLRFDNRIGHWIPEIDSENVPATITSIDASSTHVGLAHEQENLKATALLIYFMLTWERREEKLRMEEFLDSTEIEMNMLMLSLQEGLTPEEALLTPPFQKELQ